ncbi:hypothetical protein SBA3_670064 [Candidatus Sulfopaludibacter sp. SbA3]|nr:hypothetical protein SBA3_670064 [Candidatus Sulfopaludibacter sp. SbA3]
MKTTDAARDLLEKAATSRGAEYSALVEQAVRAYELYFNALPVNGYTAALSLGVLAERRSPREATWLRRKGLEWIARFPASVFMEAMEASQIAEAYTSWRASEPARKRTLSSPEPNRR